MSDHHPLLDEEVEKLKARIQAEQFDVAGSRVEDAFNQGVDAALTAVVEHLEGGRMKCPACANLGANSVVRKYGMCPTCNGTGKVEGEGRATALRSGDALGSLLKRVEGAGTSGDRAINDAIFQAADVIQLTGGRFGEFGEEIPIVAKDTIEAFLASLFPPESEEEEGT